MKNSIGASVLDAQSSPVHRSNINGRIPIGEKVYIRKRGKRDIYCAEFGRMATIVVVHSRRRTVRSPLEERSSLKQTCSPAPTPAIRQRSQSNLPLRSFSTSSAEKTALPRRS